VISRPEDSQEEDEPWKEGRKKNINAGTLNMSLKKRVQSQGETAEGEKALENILKGLGESLKLRGHFD